MIDTNRRYTKQEVAALEKQGYEFEHIALLNGEEFYIVNSYNPPRLGDEQGFLKDERWY